MLEYQVTEQVINLNFLGSYIPYLVEVNVHQKLGRFKYTCISAPKKKRRQSWILRRGSINYGVKD